MPFEDEELLKEFVVESQEHLSDVENQLLTLESQGDQMDVGLVNTVFRAIHSIKGAAGFLGLETLQSLAHREEEVLNMLRGNELRPTSEVVNTLLRATDRIKLLLDEIDSSNDQDVSEYIEELKELLNNAGESQDASNEPQEDEAQSDPSEITGLSGEALREFLVESYDNLEQLERDLVTLEGESDNESVVNSVFRNIHTIKGTAGFLGYNQLECVTHAAENLLGSVRSGQLSMDKDIGGVLFKMIDAVRGLLDAIESDGSEGEVNHNPLVLELGKLLDTKLARVSSADETADKSVQPSTAVSQDSQTPKNSSREVASKPEAASTASNKKAVQKPVAADASSSSAADSTIRVDVSLLDKLMTCVGELVLARNQIMQYTNGDTDSELHRTSQRLNAITSELQESVMKTRMQPIGNVWGKFPRLVRDLAATCEKQVRIEMEGKETELDKTIIEAIKDPLTHLVRNTVDHGIERPEARAENDKPVEGCLTLRAYHEGGQVNIEICDDGAGINFERVKSKAIERGLLTEEQASRVSDRDVGNMIFLPGFSTAEKVSNVSGRGVGMDVVKTNIEKIGGTVDLQSEPGVGTTIRIKIPLTLAIIPALIVSCDGNRYAIPQVNLRELLRLDGDQLENGLEQIQGAPVYRLRGRLLPLVDLRNQLNLSDPEDAQNRALNIVVLRADDQEFGLVVDRINDSEEIVVKPLSKQLKEISVYSGTTIMGDGKVALILDVLGLAQTSGVIAAAHDRNVAEQESNDDPSIKAVAQTLLVLGVGELNRFALPLSQITRLEKLATSKIERSDNVEVIQYRGEILPLVRLAEMMDILAAPTDETLLDVVVYTENGRSVGIVVDRIIDIVESRLDVVRPTTRQGLNGSAVIRDHVTDLLDLPVVIRQIAPGLFEEQE